MEYKTGNNFENGSLERANNNNDDESIQIEVSQILDELVQDINHPEYVFEKIPKLYEIIVDNELDDAHEASLLKKLINSNLINSLFEFAKSTPDLVPHFLEFLRHISLIENSEMILNPDMLMFLISQINTENTKNSISDIADTLANFSRQGAAVAARISKQGSTYLFIQILDSLINKMKNKEEFDDEENVELFTSILSYFEDLLNIEKYQPYDFENIVNIGFNCFDSSDEIRLSALRLIRNASEEMHYFRFEPLIKKRLDLLHLIFLSVDSEDEELSSLSFDIMLNITKKADYNFRYEIFQQIEGDLNDHLSNSISINENNIENVLEFIINLIESKTRDDKNPILSYLFDFIEYILLDFNEDAKLELKILICQTFAKITDVATNSQKVKLIQDIVKVEKSKGISFIQNLCTYFGISQETDYDLVCIIYNMLDNSLASGNEEFTYFAKSFIQNVGIEEIEKLFDEPEDPIYTYKRDELIDLLNYYRSL